MLSSVCGEGQRNTAERRSFLSLIQTCLPWLKRLWGWERLRARGEGDDRGWDGWMASLTRWMWAWVNSGSWWWTWRPGVLRFMGWQRVGHDWATELNWSQLKYIFILQFLKRVKQPHYDCNIPAESGLLKSLTTMLLWILYQYISSEKQMSEWNPLFKRFIRRNTCEK